jgi:hypothetical protein
MKEYTLVPLSEFWQEQLNKLPYLEKDFEGTKDIVALLHTADLLIERSDGDKIRMNTKYILKIANYHYFLHSYHLACSMLELTKFGFFNSNAVLVRSIVESVIDLAYLWLCKSINGSIDERKAWFWFSEVKRFQVAHSWEQMQKRRQKMGLPVIGPLKILDDETFEKLKQKCCEIKQQFPRDKWAIIKNLFERARAVDDQQTFYKETGTVLEKLYISSYKWASGFVHAESVVSQNYISKDANGLKVKYSIEPEKHKYILAVAREALICLLFLFNHINRLNVDLIKQLKESGLRID